MKKIYALGIFLSLFFCNLFSQAPEQLNYQAVVRDDGGNALNNQAVSLRVSILQGSIYGTTVYSETHAATTNQFGLVTLEIGNGTVVTGTFSAINWGSGPYFMKVEIDPSGGSSFTDMGTTQILSVPYALHSHTADEYTETDPVFGAHTTSGITTGDLANWNAAYGWGDHSLAGYLASYTETDPVFGAHAASGITGSNITNWTEAYNWGDHSLAGYLASYTETDPVFGGHAASGITGTDITNWTEAYSWGDHSLAGYLTSYTETDPVFTGHAASGITGGDITNWNTAFGWGNHAAAGYGLLAAPNIWLEDQRISHPAAPRLIIQDMGSLQSFLEFHDAAQNNGYMVFNHGSHNLHLVNQASGPVFEWLFTGDGRLMAPGDVVSAGLVYDPAGNSDQWNTAFGWGDHSLAGYLTSYTETDPVFTGHAASGISGGDIANWNTAFGWGNHAAAGYGLLAAPNVWMADQILSHPGSPRLIIQDMAANQSFIEFHDPAQINGYIVFNHGSHNLHLVNQASGPVFEWLFTGDGRLMAPGDVVSGGLVFDPGGNSSQWNAAFGWGDHALAGYLTANGTLNGLVQSTAAGNSYFTGGDVGIGTSTPLDKLHVAGNLRVDNNMNIQGNLGVVADVNASGVGHFYNLLASNVISAPVGNIDDLTVGFHLHAANAEIDDLLTVGTAFEVSNTGDLVYRNNVLFANTSGNVGIGTNSPTEKLSVDGVVESINGGFKFPDNSVQNTAAPVIKHDTYGVGVSVPPNSYATAGVSFGYTFSSAPTVTVTGFNPPPDPAIQLIPSVIGTSTSGFTLVLFNAGTAFYSGTYVLNYIAVGN